MRAAIVGIGVVVLLGAALAAGLGAPLPSLIAPGVVGLLMVVGTLAERRIYRKLADGSPGPGWRLTDERFVDPESGDVVSVYYHDRTGERRYVRLPPRPPA
jgi:hypothetical protein